MKFIESISKYTTSYNKIISILHPFSFLKDMGIKWLVFLAFDANDTITSFFQFRLVWKTLRARLRL